MAPHNSQCAERILCSYCRKTAHSGVRSEDREMQNVCKIKAVRYIIHLDQIKLSTVGNRGSSTSPPHHQDPRGTWARGTTRPTFQTSIP